MGDAPTGTHAPSGNLTLTAVLWPRSPSPSPSGREAVASVPPSDHPAHLRGTVWTGLRLPVLDRLTVPHLYLAALLKGVFDVVFQIAYQAYMPQLLDRADLVEGNVKTQLSRSLALVAGRSAGGALVGLIGAARTVTADAASYLVATATLLFVRRPESPPATAERGLSAALKDIRDSMPLVLRNRVVRHLVLMATFGNMGGSLALAMVIVYAYEDLHLSAGQLGLALSLGGVSVLIGAALSQRINERLGMGRALVLTHFVLALAFGLLPTAVLGGTSLGFVIVVVSQALSNFTMPVTNVAVMTLIQKATPSDMLGRVTGVALPFVWGANALGPVMGSAIAAAMGNVVAFLLSSLLAGTAVVWIVVGALHRLTDEVPEQLRVTVSART
ncbi:MFS transporter [Streptomyces sp. NPDC058676]|uniref:MFS transporter n=1 Tax=unclassified Streptomyces TaxID=2593676 RepID=UPI0036535B1D